MHVRMQCQDNVEISNPMYLREEDADEDDDEPIDPTFVLAANAKATNFANPVYESMYSSDAGNGAIGSSGGSTVNEEKKKGLLQNSEIPLLSHPLELRPKDHPLAD